MSISKIVALEEGNPLNSTGGDVANTINGIVDTEFSEVMQKLSRGEGVYVVAGDSTRENSYNEMIPYYTKQLGKLGFSVVNSSASGMKGLEWVNDTRAESLSQAISAIPNTGESSILEFSFGINDAAYGTTGEEFKSGIITGLDQLLSQKPDVSIVLVTPVNTSVNVSEIRQVYIDLSEKYKCQLIDATIPMTPVYGNPLYYVDNTHPSKYGSMRLVNYIMNELLPTRSKPLMTLDNIKYTPPPSVVFSPIVEENYYSNTTGEPLIAAQWRRLQPLSVEPNFTLRVKHTGNRYECMFMDINGNFLEKKSLGAELPDGYREVVVPVSAYEARFNIDNASADIPTLQSTVDVEYATNSTLEYLSQADINIGLSITMPIVNPWLIDAVGSTGSVGQVPTSQGDDTWLWA